MANSMQGGFLRDDQGALVLSSDSSVPRWVHQRRADYLAGVHPAPPTYALGAGNGATQIAGSVAIFRGTPRGDAAFRGIAGRVANAPLFPNYLTAVKSDGQPATTSGFLIEFDFYGDDIEIDLWGKGQVWQVFVDGMPISAALKSDIPSNGQEYLARLTFASVTWRRIGIWQASTGQFGGVRIKPTHAIGQPSTATGPRIGVLGDSFTEGVGAAQMPAGWAYTMAAMLGSTDAVVSGSGGTGYLNPGSGRVKFRDRAQADLLDRGPFDLIVVAGAINDSSYVDAASATAAQVGAEAQALFGMIVGSGQIPAAKRLVVIGPWWPTGTPTATTLALRTQLITAAAAVGATFVDNLGTGSSTGWMIGSGKAGAPAGNGNADLFTGADGTHPTQAGHEYLGRRVAGAIMQAGVA